MHRDAGWMAWIAAATILIGVLAFAKAAVLTVEASNGRIILVQLLRGKQTIILSFIHSSELTPWRESWLVNESGIWIYSICFESGGAGHPSSYEDFNTSSTILRVNGSLYCFEDIYRPLGRQVVLCGQTAINMSLALDNSTFRVHECIRIRVEKVFLAQFVWLKLKTLVNCVIRSIGLMEV